MAVVDTSLVAVLPDVAERRERARAAVAGVRRAARLRTGTVWVVLSLLVFIAFSFEISLGEYHVDVTDVVPAIFGQTDPITDLIVGSVRLPRALCALLAGAAFGCSGAIFQGIARNPLASPDIIGVNIGASAAAVLVIVTVEGAAYDLVSAGAFAGALLTAVAIYLLAYRQGLSPFRLVLVGIGVGEMLASVLAYLLTRADIWDAQQAARWLAGSLDFRDYEQVVPAAIGLAVLLPIACALVAPLTAMLLGDETALGIGVRVERELAAALLVVAVGLAALAVVAAGPVLFVAFVAPPIARHMTRQPVALIASGLAGALLVLSADLIGRFAFGDVELPVGVVTALLGAPYLIWLLTREPGRRHGMSDEPTSFVLSAQDLELAYGDHVVVDDLTVEIPTGAFTVIVGPNACGKSTLLRALARLLKPKRGAVLLDGDSIRTLSTREVARRLGILPQGPIAPEGITVADLVARGRSPHQGWLRQWTHADEEAVAAALVAASVDDLAHRPVDELSGGQRQRVWIAMTLAQDTATLLLDEPTTFLDLAHQIDVLDLLADLNRERGRTVVAVLHDLNQACRFAQHVIAMRSGEIVAQGPPAEVVTEQLVERVFGLACRVVPDPVTGTPMVVPISRHGTTPQ